MMPRALARPYGPVAGTARIRADAGDFRVSEVLAFRPSGSGEHLFLRVRKRGLTTRAAADALARWLGTAPREVGYAGLKDKHAITEQWFSLPSAAVPEVGAVPGLDGLEVLEATRNDRKLRRGALAGNRFRIRLVDVTAHPAAVGAALLALAHGGAPNYFGPQRFGIEGRNLRDARALLAGGLKVRGRHRRGLLLSAARSHLFNLVLAERVRRASWDRPLSGELVMLNGSHSVFPAERESEAALVARMRRMDLHPTGPLPGRGGATPTDQAEALEAAVLEPEQALVEGLSRFGVAGMRRALRVPVGLLRWQWSGPRTLEVGFTLPAGAYATAVLGAVLELAEVPAEDASEAA